MVAQARSGSALRPWFGVSLRWPRTSLEVPSGEYCEYSASNAASVFSPKCAFSHLVQRLLEYMPPWLRRWRRPGRSVTSDPSTAAPKPLPPHRLSCAADHVCLAGHNPSALCASVELGAVVRGCCCSMREETVSLAASAGFVLFQLLCRPAVVGIGIDIHNFATSPGAVAVQVPRAILFGRLTQTSEHLWSSKCAWLVAQCFSGADPPCAAFAAFPFHQATLARSSSADGAPQFCKSVCLKCTVWVAESQWDVSSNTHRMCNDTLCERQPAEMQLMCRRRRFTLRQSDKLSQIIKIQVWSKVSDHILATSPRLPMDDPIHSMGAQNRWPRKAAGTSSKARPLAAFTHSIKRKCRRAVSLGCGKRMAALPQPLS